MTHAPIPIAHVLNTAGLGGVPEAAWQLLTRLPAERWARHLYVMSPPAATADHTARCPAWVSLPPKPPPRMMSFMMLLI